MSALRDAGLRVLATTVDGEVSLDDADLSGPTAWLFGPEAHGLPAGIRGHGRQTGCASRWPAAPRASMWRRPRRSACTRAHELPASERLQSDNPPVSYRHVIV